MIRRFLFPVLALLSACGSDSPEEVIPPSTVQFSMQITVAAGVEDTDGITLLKEWASAGLLTMPVVMMSGHGTIDTAVEATRIGAFDFLEKPIALQKLFRASLQVLTDQKCCGLQKPTPCPGACETVPASGGTTSSASAFGPP